jgi:RpiB/LacA/LacB family sugar-phosphate isomerase
VLPSRPEGERELKDVVTAEDVLAAPPGGEVLASAGAIVTPWAREVAATRNVRIVLGAAAPGPFAVALGADHGGFALKEEIKVHLTRLGYRFQDLGAFSTDPVDYPDVALAVARAVRSGEARLGILVDGAGLGSAMAANKVRGIRAAPCTDPAAAKNAREHNDANVLTLGARFVDVPRMREIVEVFLTTQCTEERHRRRVRKIDAIEEGGGK